ncbi:transmembrane protein, putative [Medicago truncatula]|uniref:Transmembrane protein, putative n=1 Tax=Medicago truncatula TaxID=3880 RepID=G7INN3_MEDTR|nr:transmembrane protein, putative [Medicago truncatula]
MVWPSRRHHHLRSSLGSSLSPPFACFCPTATLGSSVASCGSSGGSFVWVLGPGCSIAGGSRCGDFPPRLILPRRSPRSFVVVWLVVVVVTLIFLLKQLNMRIIHLFKK